MAPDRFFCSVASRDCGEAIYGTVALVRSWMLIEYPGVWRRRALEDSRLVSDRVKQHLASTADRVLMIRQEHRRCGDLRCFHIDSHRAAISAARFPDYDQLPGVKLEPEPAGSLLYATCTHARHDRCCAKFGLPVACALRDTVGDRAWDCSHVGGDRFAGNVVVFPHGLYYGRVRPEDVPDLVRSSEAGEIWLPGYRGRCTHTRNVQIADYFLRRESGRLGVDDFGVVDAVRGRVRFRAVSDGSIHDVRFRTRPELLYERLTCSAGEPSAVPQYDLVSYSGGLSG